MVEAPDHGHETTSEAYSYLALAGGHVRPGHRGLDAVQQRLGRSWRSTSSRRTPTSRPTALQRRASPPRTRPSTTSPSSTRRARHVGVRSARTRSPASCSRTYGTDDIYGMHWLHGRRQRLRLRHRRCGASRHHHRPVVHQHLPARRRRSRSGRPSPQPSCDTFKYGGTNGYLDLFIKDSSYAKQWKYTNAPDADARAIQAAYWALTWAKAQGKAAPTSRPPWPRPPRWATTCATRCSTSTSRRSATAPAPSPARPAPARTASHYLLSWYYAWGGATDAGGGWAWRIGSSHDHGGYQNPLAAWALSNGRTLTPQVGRPARRTGRPASSRQLEFYTLAAVRRGRHRRWRDQQLGRPLRAPRRPVLPPSTACTTTGSRSTTTRRRNQWFGFQAWCDGAGRRVLLRDRGRQGQGDPRQVGHLGARQHHRRHRTAPTRSRPRCSWSGQPATPGTPSSPGANTGLHVTVADYTNDVGVAAAYAKTLIVLRAPSPATPQAQDHGQGAAGRLCDHTGQPRASSIAGDPGRLQPLRRRSTRHQQGLYVPPGWTGTMPNGDAIASGSTFLSIRSFYKNDPDWPKVAGVPERWPGAGVHLPPVLGAGRHRAWRWPTTACLVPERLDRPGVGGGPAHPVRPGPGDAGPRPADGLAPTVRPPGDGPADRPTQRIGRPTPPPILRLREKAQKPSRRGITDDLTEYRTSRRGRSPVAASPLYRQHRATVQRPAGTDRVAGSTG